MALGFSTQPAFFVDQRGVRATGSSAVGLKSSRAFDTDEPVQGQTAFIQREMRLGNEGVYSPSYFDDFYYRVYIQPLIVDFKSVTAEVSEQIIVWNAFPDRVSALTDIVVDNDTDITVEPEAPIAFAPTAYKTFDMRAGTSGPAEINAIIRFSFSTEDEDIAVRVIGNRVTAFSIPAEIPVSETWKWYTDTIIAQDGSEQTVSVSGGEHRVSVEYKVQLITEDEVREFKTLLLSGIGKIFTPEWQHSAIVSGVSGGSTDLVFDKRRCDVRPGEFAMLTDKSLSAIVQVSELTADGARLMQPLAFSFDPASVRIVPGATGIIGDASIVRQAIDAVGEVQINARLQRFRADIKRPQDATVVERFMGMPVLDRRPYANSSIEDTFVQELVEIDNGHGTFDVRQDIAFARVKGSRRYTIQRVKSPEEMDYWKAFASAIRGSAKPFLLRSFRPDLRVIGGLTGGLFTARVASPAYAQKVFPRFTTHRILRVENSAGEHAFLRVTDARVDDSGLNSLLTFDTPLPTGYTAITAAEICMPVRLEGDTIKWAHQAMSSEVEISFRSTMIDGV